MKTRIQQLQSALQSGLIERETPVRLALLAALSGEHLLLIGAPGTAKSALARRLHLVFDHGQYFERLLTRFSVPEELFGPLSIKALENDRYERLTQAYLPDASIAFIDEIFKANSAILNALLTILNEREFDNGSQRIKIPLVAVIAASNELPEGDELDALYDRFLLRYHVEPISPEGFKQLLTLENTEIPAIDPQWKLSHDDLQQIQTQSAQVLLDDDVQYLLSQLREHLTTQNIYASDRRWRKLVKLLKVAAWTDGRNTVDVWDCWLLQHCLWYSPEQRTDILQWYEKSLGADAIINPARLTRLADAWENTLNNEQGSHRQLNDENGNPLYLNTEGELTLRSGHQEELTRNGEALYLAPPDQTDRTNNGKGYQQKELASLFFDDHYQQCHIDGKWVSLAQYTADPENRLTRDIHYPPHAEPIYFSQTHVAERVQEVQVILDAIKRYEHAVDKKLLTLKADISQRLWIEKAFVIPAHENLQQSLRVVQALGERIEKLRNGFSQLPVK